MNVRDAVWYSDYVRTTDDCEFVLKHFVRDFIFQHRLRYMFYFRIAQNTHNHLVKLFCEYKLFRLCRKYGLEIKTSTKIGKGFCMMHPYNITISTYAIIGRNFNIGKGATIGYSPGRHPGAPKIGNSVQVGINSTVIGGITIGDDVLIAPNTLVNQDIPSHSLVIGCPAIIIPRENATQGYIGFKV